MSEGGKIYINEAEADNYMGLRHFRALFRPGVNLIKGPNGSGKSSVFNLVSWLFFGRVCKEVGWRAPEEMLRQGEEKGGGVLRLAGGDIEIKGVLSEKNQKGTITGRRRILASDGVTEKWIGLSQKEVLAMVSRMGIEPGNLLSKSQVELQQAVERILGPEYVADMLQLDKDEELLLDKRTAAKARIGVLGTPTFVDKVEHEDTADLDRQLAEARAFNAKQVERRLHMDRAQKDLDKSRAEEVEAQEAFAAHQDKMRSAALDAIEAVKTCSEDMDEKLIPDMVQEWRNAAELVNVAKAHAEVLDGCNNVMGEATREVENRAEALDKLDPPQPEEDITELQARRDRAGENNAKVAARARYDADMAKLEAEQKKLEQVEADLVAMRQRRKDRAAGVKMPVEGMVLTSAGLRIKNPLQPTMTLPLDQLNQAERVRIYLQIVAADDPDLRVLVLRDDNPFDPRTQQEIVESALDLGLQVLIESKGTTPEIPGACVIRILSGEDVEADDPRWKVLAGLEKELGDAATATTADPGTTGRLF